MKPIVLVILDGWGLSPTQTGNATLLTPTPNFDKLISIFPATSISASGEEVGLDWGEMGNSEVGHLNLGTGRVVMQDLPRINKSIIDKTFFENSALIDAFNYAKKNNSNLHMMGLFSAGGVHSHLNHLLALIELSKQQQFTRVYLHLISDGRDTPEKTILNDLPKLHEQMQSCGIGKIASLSGRYFAMDRDNRKERTDKAFEALVNPKINSAPTIETAIEKAYNTGKSDEFIEPIIIGDTPRIKEKDAVIFFNFRADRAKQISDKIIDIKNVFFVSFTSYGREPTPLVKIAYFADKITHQLAEELEKNNFTQLHIAETEKYPHVTYFFNGGREEPYSGEKRILVPSPKVATYDLKPVMSADEILTKFITTFKKERPNFTVINFANPDMVGHTGVLKAAQIAIAKVDECLGKVAQEVLNNDADLIVTADHGNVEQMINPETGEIDKEHSTNPVPLIIGFLEKMQSANTLISMEQKVAFASQQPTGILADVTATIIDRLKMNKPQIISGQSLEAVI